MARRRLALAGEPVSGEAGEGAPVSIGDVVDLDVTSLASGGAGVGRLPDGRVCFVHRTAPGDRARVRVTGLKRSWARARLVQLLESGRGRREAPCPHYELCGGCTLEHLEYREQLRWKARIVADALERIGGLEEVDAPEVVPSEREFRYRSRVAFHLERGKDGSVVAGFHELENPGNLVDVGGDCLLPEEPLARIWAALRAAWGPSARRLPVGSALRLTLRSAEGGAVLLVEPEGAVGSGDPPEGEGPRDLVREVPGLLAVWWRRSPGESPVLLAGTREVSEIWMDRRIRLSPTAFLQVNRAVGELLHRSVVQALRDVAEAGGRIVDAYCGVGAWGRQLAAAGGTVVGIETDPEAVRTARREAPAGFSVVEGRVEDQLESVLPADAVVVNPPRTGLDPSIPTALGRSDADRVVYVSCDPATLARDLERLGGVYRLERVRCFDLFPQTAHVETLATLVRSGTAPEESRP